MANDYTSSTDAFAEIPEGNYSSSDYANMANYVTVASRLIDGLFGRWDGFFYPTTDDVTRYYNGSGGIDQTIDEFASITSVSVAEQGGLASSDYTAWTENTDYIVKPYNHTADGKPIYCLELVDFNGTKGAWYCGQKSVKVVGVAGYSIAVNSLVAQACKIQAVRWFMRAKGGWQDAGGNETMGTMRYKGAVELDGDIRAMLFPLILELT